MNTANLQLQGLLAVCSALLRAIEQKGVLSREQIEAALHRAEADAAESAQQHDGLSDAHVDAVRFPARYLRMALSDAAGARSYARVATAVGRTKDSDEDRLR
jgi:hypothetical protein